MKAECRNKKRTTEVEKLQESFAFLEKGDKEEGINLQKNVVDLADDESDDMPKVIPMEFTMESL